MALQALKVSAILTEEKVAYVRVYVLVQRRRRKIRRTSGKFQVLVSRKLRGRFLSNLVCVVLYMVGLTYVNLIEIAPIVL